MSRTPRRYALDTNLFIDAARDDAENAALERFHAAHAPFMFLSAVVVQELRAGVRAEDAAALDRHMIAPFERRARVVTPTFAAWKQSGEVLRRLVAQDGLELAKVRKSLVNDILLALSCREAGIVVLARNTRDFERIAHVAVIDWTTPWPEVSPYRP